MGQRHQIFVVARVSAKPGEPKKYRCITALHHQWCYGRIPLFAVHAFNRLAQRPSNARVIQQELGSYHELSQQSARCPAPYTTFLAECAFTTNLSKEGSNISKTILLDARMGSTDGDNNDGITVLDVTTPGIPAYCFVKLGRRSMRPLTAREYLRGYYSVPDPDQIDSLTDEEKQAQVYNLEAISNLADMPLVTKDTLSKVWPEEYGVVEDDDLEDPSTDLDQSLVSRLQKYRSLTSLEEVVAWLKDEAVSEVGVDLSGLPLDGQQLLTILKGLGPFKRLNVSGNQQVDKDVFLQILEAHKPLHWINIIGCSISKDDLKELFSNHKQLAYSVGRIIHPAFITGERKNEFPNALRFTLISRSHQSDANSISLPFFGIDQLIQNLTDVVELCNDPYCSSLFMEPNVGNLSAIFASTRGKDDNWHERDVEIVPRRSFDLLRGGGYDIVVHNFFDQQSKYAIVPPPVEGQQRKIMDISAFLEHLEEAGSPPSDPDAAKKLVDLVNSSFKLMLNLNAAMFEMARAAAVKERITQVDSDSE